jgi:putative tricarboxylic transport membrane protein
MLEGIMIGLEAAFSLQNLLMVVAGCLIGTFIGMLPGLGPMSIIAIMIPVAITLGDPAAALILLGRRLLRRDLRRLDLLDPAERAGGRGDRGDEFRRLPDGAEGAGGQGADHRRGGEFRGRHDRRDPADDLRAGAVDRGAPVPLRRILRADGRGPFGHRGLRGHGAGRQGADDDDPRADPRHRGRGRAVQHAALHAGADGPAIGLLFITLAMAMFALPEAMFLVLNPARGAGGDSGSKITDCASRGRRGARWRR